MRANSLQNWLGITCFGESHGPALGVVLQDITPGVDFPYTQLKALLAARKPGNHPLATPRQEDDDFEIISGVLDGKTTGMPICLLFKNKGANSADYEHLQNIFRPGHADFALFKKFKIYDWRGGGRLSGRETISRVAASALVQQLLNGIDITFTTRQIGPYSTTIAYNNYAATNALCWPDEQTYTQVNSWLQQLKQQQNSAGAVLEITINNLPAGLGDPVFEKLDANLAKALLSIGAVKGIEFGSGFALGNLTGARANDQLTPDGFLSNHSGGINGGISTGQPLVMRLAVKPPSGIGLPQQTINTHNMPQQITVGGRHDTILIPRLVPVAKAMIQLTLADALAYQGLVQKQRMGLDQLREAIDKVDEDILIALYRRLQLAKAVGQVKQHTGKQVSDPTREQELLAALRIKAQAWGIPTDLVNKLWPLLIGASKQVQTTK